MNLALFDLDNTLIAGDSDHLWGEFLIERGLVDGEYYRQQNDAFYQDYRDAKLDMNAYLAFALAPLARRPLTTLTQLHSEFMQSHIAPVMLPKARALLEQHRSLGDTLVIITATNRFVTAPIAAHLQVPHLIATEAELDEHGYTGRACGIPCFQQGKVERLQAWLSEHPGPFERQYFYSDSINDLPLLCHVDVAIAVDPDPRLRAEAQARNWSIISLRGPETL